MLCPKCKRHMTELNEDKLMFSCYLCKMIYTFKYKNEIKPPVKTKKTFMQKIKDWLKNLI